jgi:hypothetical protein
VSLIEAIETVVQHDLLTAVTDLLAIGVSLIEAIETRPVDRSDRP